MGKGKKSPVKGETRWGKVDQISWFYAIGSLFFMVMINLMVFTFWAACRRYGGDLTATISDVFDSEGLFSGLAKILPMWQLEGVLLYFAWLGF